MSYDLFLFDLDDTLLDFRASEKQSFFSTLQTLGLTTDLNLIFESYQKENRLLWQMFEQAKTTKEHLRVERFRKTFASHKIDLDPEMASTHYLERLPETVVLIDHATEICQWLSSVGEIGIITNGIQSVQARRIQNSKLAPYISFICVSEEAGFAKPDIRFFEYTVKRAKKFTRASTIIVGDRLETDILGGHQFGIDSCWFNPARLSRDATVSPKYEVHQLSELRDIFK